MPSKAALRARDPKRLVQPLLQPLRTELDGLKVTYVPFVAPPRPRSYARWGAWAAPTLMLALRNRFDLVHAHYAVPAGDAARRQRAPLVISVHGGDVLGVAERFKGGREAVTRAFEAATLTLANSTAIADRSRALGARDVRVVHLGTDVPTRPRRGTHLVTVGNLIARKRHADVLHALTRLPDARYVIVGDGPRAGRTWSGSRASSASTGGSSSAAPSRPREALAEARRGGRLRPAEHRGGVRRRLHRGDGRRRARDRHPRRARPGGDRGAAAAGCASSRRSDPRRARRRDPRPRSTDDGAAARANVEANFTWERCGAATLAAYEDALR